MRPRSFACHSILAALSLTGFAMLPGCSTGIGQGDDPSALRRNKNMNTGVFLVPEGQTLSAPITDHAAAGGVIPAAGPALNREVVFYAFVSSADATEITGGIQNDINGSADVFITAVVRNSIDKNAFSYSLAGKIRHPRCVNCHTIRSPSTWLYRDENGDYATAPHGIMTGPSGELDRLADPEECKQCHADIIKPFNDRIHDGQPDLWRAPDPDELDPRGESIATLANRVRTSAFNHMRFDARVNWALDGGITPTAALNANGIADDTHDGRDTVEDVDLLKRLTPGRFVDEQGNVTLASEQMFDQVDLFRQLDGPSDTREALAATALVSRSQIVPNQTGDAASRAPSVAYVPNPAFDRFVANGVAGTLYVSFVSSATDLATLGSSNNNGQADVYLTTIDVFVQGPGNGQGAISFQYRSTRLVSHVTASLTTGGNNPSASAVISGDGRFVAFASTATDLAMGTGFSSNNGVFEADVFRWDRSNGLSTLVSAAGLLPSTQGGNGLSAGPSISFDGADVAFESDSTDLIVGDTNGFRDVFCAQFDGAEVGTLVRASVRGDGSQATGGDSHSADVLVTATGEIHVAYISAADLGEAGIGTYDLCKEDS
ncbi:MAG: hypothetical protein V3T22_09425, partial [Planctomycetota bacterium]